MRVFGIDPGATTGWACIEAGQAPMHLVSGAEPDFAEARLRELLGVLSPDLVVIECIDPAMGIPASRATHLVACAALGGRLYGFCKGLSVPVTQYSAFEWRKAIVGRSRASDALIKTWWEGSIENRPAQSNAHMRDATGLAVYAWQRAKLRSLQCKSR